MQCERCAKMFSSIGTLNRHKRVNCRGEVSVDAKKLNICENCNKVFSKPYGLKRHQLDRCLQKSDNLEVPCKKIKLDEPSTSTSTTCNQLFSTVSNLNKHKHDRCRGVICRKRITRDIESSPEDGVVKLRSAFKNRIASYRFSSKKNHIDPSEFLIEVKQKVLNLISEYIQNHHSLKVNMELFGLYVIPEKDMRDIKSFNTENQIINISKNLSQVFDDFKDVMLSKASEFQERDSGWTLQQVMFLDVNINKFSPLSGSSYIRLPLQIERKQAVLNLKNVDNCCFAWSINAAVFPANGDPANPTSYPHYSTLLNFDGIDLPMKLQDIPKFETSNNISMNVFGTETEYKNGKMVTEIIGPLHFTSSRKPTHVNLLLLSDDSGNQHYCLITNLSRLVSMQKSKHNGAVHICDGCIQFFPSIKKLQAHQENDCNHLCTTVPTTNLKINKYGKSVPENILKFENIEKQLEVPFVIYADFESLLKPISHAEPCDSRSFTVKTFEHEPYSFGFYVKCNFNDEYSQYCHYRGTDAADVFCRKLDEVVQDIYNDHLKHVVPMTPLTTEEETLFANSKTCGICDKEFTETDIKVRDHCHLTGKWRFSSHQTCNLNYQVPKFIPVFFHNLTNYDSHLFIKKLALNEENVDVIAQNKEKYVSFSKRILVEKSSNPKIPSTYMKIKFVDSFRFLPRSLDKLSQTLESSQCSEIRKYFQDDTKFNMIRQKGVFPYSYVDSFAKLDEQQLPSRDKFYDNLRGESVSDENYTRALKVWNTFNCSTLGEYSDVYLKSDVLLLTDIFENFRKVCLEKYKLDPAQYLTAPSLSWDAMLRCTQVELELLTDIEMIHFFKKGIRGGVAQCTKRKAVANNKFLPNYDPSKPTSYIMYLDATNLYGYSMQQRLPTGDFRWLKKDEIFCFNCTRIGDNSSKGYVVDVDLEYPSNLHKSHNNLPFCPENMIPPNSKIPKLIPNLHDKQRYVIHYRNLKQCLKYGLKIKKIHRVLEFTQSAWLKSYIDLNTALRNSAKNDFERELFKLLTNSVFGKTMENVEKRQDIRLRTHWKNKKGALGAESLISKPYFKTCSIFDKNLTAIQMGKVKICYDKPLYVGFCILDISKTVMYDFYYGYVKEKYGDNATLCYMDTDSLILEILTDNVYEDMKENIELFDTSNYPIDNIHRIPKTLSVVGKMKDEYSGTPIESFYGTGAKAYCVKAANVMKKAKGVAKNVIQNQLDFTDYAQIVENGGIIFRKMQVFTSSFHTIYTELKNKVALSAQDDKRFVIRGDVKTLAWGHFVITPNPQADPDLYLDEFLRLAREMEELEC